MEKVKVNVWKGKKDKNIHLSDKEGVTYCPKGTSVEKFFKKYQKK